MPFATAALAVEDARITVPPTSPFHAKLGIAEVDDKKIQHSLTLPAVVVSDPARTAKVLPSVAGRVVDLKAQLGARVAAGDVLAVIESGDLAQAVSDLEEARSALTLRPGNGEVGRHAQRNRRSDGSIAGFGGARQRHRQILEDLDARRRTDRPRSGSRDRLRTPDRAIP
jgi:multidrug efflux pump subunit AcrA (membrane-fusion protein)